MTTPFPLNQAIQIAENAILDLNGKQAYLGNSFNLSFSASLSDTEEHAEILITNPSTSNKSLFIFESSINGTLGAFANFYIMPIIGANGNAITPVNLRPAYNTISIAKTYSSPTISSNGTLIINITTAIASNILMVIDPGYSLLITAQAFAATAMTAIIQTSWYEI